MKLKQRILCSVAGMLFVGFGYVQNGIADSSLTYGLSYINTFTSCDALCQEGQLRWADDQINQLDTQLRKAGMTKQFKYANTMVQSTDIVEDYYGGYDRIYGDNVHLYAITTHGGTNNGVYSAVYCSSGNPNSYSSCLAKSNKMILGESNNNFNNTYSSHVGKLRWLILSTCHSMDESPMSLWSNTFNFGLDYLLGYKGTMRLGETTDECLADFARNAFGGESKFKKVWFSANDDWWIDNTAGVFACGDPISSSEFYSNYWRDNYCRTWNPRKIYTSGTFYCSWSYHKG
jgi:hypothetical protein